MGDDTTFIALPRDSHESTRDYAIRCLEYNIIRLMLYPGQNLSEARISELLGISRTPVREAFFDLSKIGIVEIFPQKGTKVSLIDTNLVEEVRFMRWIVERAIVKLACEKSTAADLIKLKANFDLQKNASDAQDMRGLLELDNAMHELLFVIAKKEFSYSLIKRISVHFDRVRMLNLINLNYVSTLDEHGNLIRAFEEKNATEAIDIIDRHLSHVTEYLPALKKLYGEFFKN